MPDLSHDSIIEFITLFAPQVNRGLTDDGVCDGATAMWIQAVLTSIEDENLYYNRLSDISVYLEKKSVENLKSDIDQLYDSRAKNKIKSKLTENELKLTEIRAFAEAIAVQQEPGLVFDKTPINQNEKEKIYPLTSSEKLDKTGAFYINSIGVLIPTVDELKNYLIAIQTEIVKSNCKKPIVFMVSSFDHVIGFYYNSDLLEWRYFDINLLTEECFFISTESVEDLAPLIFSSFEDEENEENDIYAPFSLLSVSRQPKTDLIRQLKKITNAALNLDNRQCKRNITALFIACQSGLLEQVRMIIEKNGAISINTPNVAGITPLWIACQNGHFEIVQYLLANGAEESVSIPNREQTPLFIACSKGHYDIVLLLLIYGAEKIINQPNLDMITPLSICCERGYLDIAKLLLHKGAKESINSQRLDGTTALYIACQNGHFDVVQYLLANGAEESIFIPGFLGQTPLFTACANGHYDIVLLLLIYGAEKIINQPNLDMITPLSICCERGYLNIAKLLLHNGAKESINSQTQNGTTALYIACEYNHVDLVELLLENGAKESINTPGFSKQTPLWSACVQGNFKLVRLLIENGADVNALDIHEQSPLGIACLYRYESIVRFLLKHGAKASVNTPNNLGIAPLQIAFAYFDFKIADLLTKYGAKKPWGYTIARQCLGFSHALIFSKFRTSPTKKDEPESDLDLDSDSDPEEEKYCRCRFFG